jgi:hypothetical protein
MAAETVETNEPVASGRCYCGAIVFRVEGLVSAPCICHCDSCRRATGAPFVAWGTVDSSRFHIERGALRRVQRLAGIERGFCADCGTSLTYQKSPETIDFVLTALSDSGRWPPVMHIWMQDKLPWIVLADELPRHWTLPTAVP